jgi:PKD repeat protein
MQARPALLVSVTFLGLWLAGCSSGLGNNLPGRAPEESGTNSNLPLGLDLGVVPNAPLGGHQLTGLLVPQIGDTAAREVVLLAFATAAAADNADGNGTPLSRDAATDGNSAEDVFVAAVSARDVEPRAFSQSLAGKFRHPRCVTCHSLQAPDTLAFATASQPHAGPLPGVGFPINDPATCVPCHVSSTNVPVPGWQAPAASFDLRNQTVAQLAQRAQNAPADETEHFVTDKRVLWALDSGVLPQVGGRNGIADDDHDGVDEPEDNDGVIRTVPGGSARFIEEIEAWVASGRVVSTASAVRDLTLVSRATGGNAAAGGASTGPRLLWVPNSSFNPTTASTAAATNPIGTLHVVFESTGSDLGGSDTNGASDIYRALVELRAEEDENGNAAAGGLNLRYLDGSTVLVSARSGTVIAGNGASTRAVIAGASGQTVLFESLATDLVAGFTDGNGAGNADVYLRQLGGNSTLLVSHAVGNAATGGNGASSNASSAPNGSFAAFESDASDLVASDGNAVRDVWFTRIDAGSPFTKQRASVTSTGTEGTGGASGPATIHADGSGRVLVAFQSEKTDLAAGLVAPTNVYLFDSATGNSTLLNQRISPNGNAIGDGTASAPVISADGSVVAFASTSTNIDVLRPLDRNAASDVFLIETAQVANGNVLPYRISMTAAEASDGNGASTAPVLGSLSGSSAFQVGAIAYTTTATNLGTSDSTSLIVAFLDETSGVLANFSAGVVRGAAPLSVTFTDGSSGTPTSWQWDFQNDGTVDSTVQNPTFVYTTPGTFTVRLVAANANGNGTKTATDLVLVVDVPTANFTSTPANGTAPLSVTFTDTSTQSPTAWAWDFDNDGSVDSTLQNPTHVYTTPGTFAVKLTATNEAGSAEVTRAGAVEVFAPVVANFTRSPTSGVAPVTVNFNNSSTGATSYAWDFDEDGLVDSSDTNPSFLYTSSGTFDVTLTAFGPGGNDTFTFADCVTVFGSVNANFTMTVGGSPINSAYEATSIQFTSTSTGTITSHAWDFDFVNSPGTLTSSSPSLSRNFANTTASTRVFAVRLTVSGPGGTSFAQQNLTIVSDTETIDISPSADNTIYSNATNSSNGAGVDMVAGTANTNGPRRGLIRFSITAVPAGSTINSATMTLTNTSPQGALQLTGTRTLTFHRATVAWTEGSSDAGLLGGAGAAAAGGGATWVNRTTPATAWTSPGGDFVGTATASITVNDALGAYNSGNLAADVQAWRNGTATNFGWVIVGDEGVGKRVKWFATKENPTVGSRPNLRVVYTRPLP